MPALAIVVLASLIAAPRAPGSDQARPPEPALARQLASLVDQLSDGWAKDNSDAQVVTSEGTVFVLFSLHSHGGGNGARQYLAAFHQLVLPSPELARPYSLLTVAPVGESFDRFFKRITVVGGQIVLEGRKWAPRDSHCCPSLDARAVYALSPRGLSERSR